MSDDKSRRGGTPTRPGKAAREQRRRPPRQRREPRQPRQPPKKSVKTQAAKLDEYFDIHIRCGLEDSVVRISRTDYGSKVTLAWMLDRQDIVFRTRLKGSEVIILLRGNDNARLRITASSPSKKLPMFKVHLASELREQLLNGIGKNDE